MYRAKFIGRDQRCNYRHELLKDCFFREEISHRAIVQSHRTMHLNIKRKVTWRLFSPTLDIR